MYRVADLMTRTLVTLRESDDLTLADDILALGRFRHLPSSESGANCVSPPSSSPYPSVHLAPSRAFHPGVTPARAPSAAAPTGGEATHGTTKTRWASPAAMRSS